MTYYFQMMLQALLSPFLVLWSVPNLLVARKRQLHTIQYSPSGTSWWCSANFAEKKRVFFSFKKRSKKNANSFLVVVTSFSWFWAAFYLFVQLLFQLPRARTKKQTNITRKKAFLLLLHLKSGFFH